MALRCHHLGFMLLLRRVRDGVITGALREGTEKMGDKKKRGNMEGMLNPREERELEALLDRLNVQSPEGESFVHFLTSLRAILMNRESLTTVLLERISYSPSPGGIAAFCALKDIVRHKHLQKRLRKAEYRLSQRGYPVTEEHSDGRVVLFRSRPEQVHTLGEARLYRVPQHGRRLVSLFVPADDAAGYHIVGGTVITGMYRGENLDPSTMRDERMSTIVEAAGKRAFRAFDQQMRQRGESVVISFPYGVSAYYDLAEVYAGRYEAVSLYEIHRAKELLSAYLPADHQHSLAQEIGLLDPLPPVSEAFLMQLALTLSPFMCEAPVMENVAVAVEEVLRSPIACGDEVRHYHAAKRIWAWLREMDAFTRNLYRVFLEDWAVCLARRHACAEMASVLTYVAGSLCTGEHARWERFFTVHLSLSLMSFARLRMALSSLREGERGSSSRLVTTFSRESEGKGERWKLLGEFLFGMNAEVLSRGAGDDVRRWMNFGLERWLRKDLSPHVEGVR